MATLYQGINGPLSGRVGTVVGYMWKQRACLRTYRSHINYPNTASQQQQRDWFVAMVRFAAQAKQALRLGLRQVADEAGMTEGNYFVMKNKACFGRNREAAEVDYGRLQLAEGPAADVYFRQAKFCDNEVVEVDFEKNTVFSRANGDDRVYLYAYAPALGSGVLSAPAERRSRRVAMRLPEQWNGLEVHLYGFVVDRSGRPSNSTYVGVGRVNCYEERGRYIPLNKNWNDFVNMANEANVEATAAPTADRPADDLVLPVVDIFGDPPEVP